MRPLGTGFIAVFGYSSKLKSKQAANKVKLRQVQKQVGGEAKAATEAEAFHSLHHLCVVAPREALQSKFEVFPTQLDSSRFDSIFRTCSIILRVASSHSLTLVVPPKPTGKPKDTAQLLGAYRNIFDFSRIRYGFVFVPCAHLYFICLCASASVFVFVFVFVLNAIKYPSGMQHFS